MSGIRTFVKNPDGTQPSESNTQVNEYPQRALPSPPWKRDKSIEKPVTFNVPGPSPEKPEKNIHEDKERTPGVPGDQEEKPDTTPRITPKRRTNLEAARGRFPSEEERQDNQFGEAKLYYQKYYRSHQNEINQKAKQFYQRNKSKELYQKDKELRKEHPEKFERKNRGFHTIEERSRAEREKEALLIQRVADFYYEKQPPESMPKENWYGKASDPLMKGIEKDKAPASYMNDITEITNNPGSAKVMPETSDLENVNDDKMQGHKLAIKIAVKISEILDSCDAELHRKAEGIQAKLVRADSKNLVWLFDVKGSEPKPYRVKAKAIPFGNVKDINKMDILITCSCPYWQWQGPEHWAHTRGYLYGRPRGTAEAPNIKDPTGKHGCCKHAIVVLNKMTDFIVLHPKKTASNVHISRVVVCHSDFDMLVQSVVLRYNKDKPEEE
jgi:hypothetical protein